MCRSIRVRQIDRGLFSLHKIVGGDCMQRQQRRASKVSRKNLAVVKIPEAPRHDRNQGKNAADHDDGNLP